MTATMLPSERILGVKVSYLRSASGRVTAQSGYGHATADSYPAARAAIRKVIAADKRREKAARSVKPTTDARKRCTLTGCSGAADTAAHRRTAVHRNAIAWREHSRSTRY